MDAGTVLVRRSQPCELDQAPYGTPCRVNGHHNEYDIYLQIGHNEEHPRWELLGNFNEKSDPYYLQAMIDNRLRKNMQCD